MKKSTFSCRLVTEIFKLKLHCLLCAALLLRSLDKQFGVMESLTFVSEVASRRFSTKQVLLKFSQNAQDNTCGPMAFKPCDFF